MFEALASVLNLIMQPCYQLTGNWWVSIFLFTVICKIILMPLSLWCQKNSIVMVTVMPAINRLKVQYYGDRETIGEKQSELFKEKKYHPMLSLVPLAVQVLILFGLVDVIHGVTDGGAPGTEFLGMVPTVDGGLSWIMPVLAGLSAVALGFAQNAINPLQKEQTDAEKNFTNGLSIALSLVLGVFVAAGMAFYWICSNLTAILVQVLCNLIVKPAKYIDYDDLEESRKEVEALESLVEKKKWWQKDPLSKREKADYERFFNVVNKHIVYYTEGSNYYRFFQGGIEYLLAHSNVAIHYVTNDPDDIIFDMAKDNPRIQPYFVREKKAITLMMKMDADVVVTTQDDLDNYYIKRSRMRKDIEYVFMFHHMSSTHLVAQKEAYDHYDTILCVGPHQEKEIRAAEKLYGLPEKKLVECGYDLLDKTIESYEALDKAENSRPVVLIAPSWQEDCIPDSCIDDIIRPLLGGEYQIVVRPHPEYVKRYRPRWDAIIERYAGGPDDQLRFDDFRTNTSIYSSDVMITDWSSVAFEFSFSTLKPTLFINTKMKVGNPHYEELGIVAKDIAWRDELGVSLDPNDLGGIREVIDDMVQNQSKWHDQIERVRSESIFNVGHGAEFAGRYLLDAVIEHQEAKEAANND